MNKINTPIPNGRLDLLTSNMKPYPFFLEKHDTNNFEEAVSTVYELNELQRNFFSKKNLDLIQNSIRRQVLTQANFSIAPQSLSELKIIMKSTYLQFGQNLSKNVGAQTDSLNNSVLEYCVKTIISNIRAYNHYKQRVSYTPIPLELPKNMSNSGKKLTTNVLNINTFNPLHSINSKKF
tara:strand:+ start:1139 stop:1675 length:537 start_codon:yes stop_codon:yes gene_type:complete